MASFFQLTMAVLISLNLNGLRDLQKREAVKHWLVSSPANLFCLQETHSTSEIELSSWFPSFTCVSSPGTHKKCGVAILFRKSAFSLLQVARDDQGRFVQADLASSGSAIRVISLYAPNHNPERNLFLEQISARLDPSFPTILAGDLNSVFDTSLDRKDSSSTNSNSHESVAALNRLLSFGSLFDSWRHCHPQGRSFSWTSSNGTKASRIDHILFPSMWLHKLKSVSIQPTPYSDHCFLEASFDLPEPVSRGPGYWKLNVSILSDSVYRDKVSEFWSFWVSQRPAFGSLANWWDVGKHKLKALTIKYCTFLNTLRKSKRLSLHARLKHLQSELDAGHLSVLPELKALEREIESIDSSAARGAQIRSRARWVEEGETSSAYFCRLEKKRGNDSYVTAIRSSSGRTCTELLDIMEVWTSFYQSLYTAVPTDPDIQEELLSNLSRHLSPDESEACEGALSSAECLVALQGMSRRKTPGLDGFPAEFYLTFWDLLGSDLVAVLNSCYDTNSLCVSQRRGLITLLFKKNDRLDCANWRPISLLCVDYKLASRTIAGRLLKVIASVTSPDQTCGVPGRFIGSNISLLRDVVDFVSTEDLPCAILSLDQEKAFDKVDWGFLLKTLSSMGFGPSFCRWVKLFYTDIQSAVIVNGHISCFFSLSRGVRQGCPLSALLYVLVAEVLGSSLRASPDIVGVTIPGSSEQAVTSQYADDTTVIVSSFPSIDHVFRIFAKYERASGARLNRTKCKGLLLGPWAVRTDFPADVLWDTISLSVLGSVVGPGDVEHLIWDNRLSKLSSVLDSWRQRSLTFSGKALVANALALSGLWHCVSVATVPDWVIKDVNSQLFSFFWSGKRDLVSRRAVCQPKERGGFAVPDLSSRIPSFHVQWIRRYCDEDTGSWKLFFTYFLRSRLGLREPLLALYYPDLIISSNLPPFYDSVMRSWQAVGGCFSTVDGELWACSSSEAFACRVQSLTVARAYRFFLEREYEPPSCHFHFAADYGPLYWEDTWSQLHSFPLDRPVIDLSWKIAHGVLPVGARLSGWGMAVDPSCFCGCPSETLEHLFFHCSLAENLLAWVQGLLFSTLPSFPGLEVRHVLFGFSPDERRVVPKVFSYLLGLVKHRVWISRNDFRFRDIQPSFQDSLAIIQSRLKFNLSIFEKRFKSETRQRYFTRQWLLNGRLARFFH